MASVGPCSTQRTATHALRGSVRPASPESSWVAGNVACANPCGRAGTTQGSKGGIGTQPVRIPAGGEQQLGDFRSDAVDSPQPGVGCSHKLVEFDAEAVVFTLEVNPCARSPHSTRVLGLSPARLLVCSARADTGALGGGHTRKGNDPLRGSDSRERQSGVHHKVVSHVSDLRPGWVPFRPEGSGEPWQGCGGRRLVRSNPRAVASPGHTVDKLR